LPSSSPCSARKPSTIRPAAVPHARLLLDTTWGIRPLPTVDASNDRWVGNYSPVIGTPTVVVRGATPPRPSAPSAPPTTGRWRQERRARSLTAKG
jgi:hypothetical protein